MLLETALERLKEIPEVSGKYFSRDHLLNLTCYFNERKLAVAYIRKSFDSKKLRSAIKKMDSYFVSRYFSL